jgi:hypothetical protein
MRNPPAVPTLAAFLPGQTSTRDADAILRWVILLSERPHYYQVIVDVANAIIARALSLEMEILQHELFLCVVECMSNPVSDPSKKWPGMRFALGSKFLRNLGWSGFKPDRHIKRLLGLWVPELLMEDSLPHRRAVALTNIIGHRDPDLIKNLKFSLAGIEICPEGCHYSEIDNLIWMLGAYVLKKREESRNLSMLIVPSVHIASATFQTQTLMKTDRSVARFLDSSQTPIRS